MFHVCKVKTMVFWDVTSCGLVRIWQRFRQPVYQTAYCCTSADRDLGKPINLVLYTTDTHRLARILSVKSDTVPDCVCTVIFEELTDCES
jgi:hypothetical protein